MVLQYIRNATINVHILKGAMFFSCTSDNPVTSTANTTQNFIGGSFKLDKTTADRTYYKYKRTA